MFIIRQITNDPLQQQSIVYPADGSLITIQMYYRPLQLGWFFNSIAWNNFLLEGIRIVNSPDILYQWRNQVPFGFACFTAGNREPTQQEDFASGASKLYLLTEEEVTQYREFLEGG